MIRAKGCSPDDVPCWGVQARVMHTYVHIVCSAVYG